jgi:hypothetical protein
MSDDMESMYEERVFEESLDLSMRDQLSSFCAKSLEVCSLSCFYVYRVFTFVDDHVLSLSFLHSISLSLLMLHCSFMYCCHFLCYYCCIIPSYKRVSPLYISYIHESLSSCLASCLFSRCLFLILHTSSPSFGCLLLFFPFLFLGSYSS